MGAVLGLIPARAGSKAIPGKNLVDVGGRPLLVWTIEAAKGAATLDRVVVSSDDQRIISVALEQGCDAPFVRPQNLATDTAKGIEVALHALDTLDETYEYIVYLQPTSPFRTSDDIDAAVRLCLQRRAPSCVSVSETPKSPYWMYTLDEEGRLQPLIETQEPVHLRQEAPPVYALNGAVYVARVDWLQKQRNFVGPGTIAYVMPQDRSLDIDEPEDLEFIRTKIPR
jgi:N-acylneuraminate cytidylyltransferase